MKHFILLAALLLSSEAVLHAAEAAGCGHVVGSPAAENIRPLLGVIRWDMYTGHPYATQKQEFGFLKPEQFQWRAPFFVRRTGNSEEPLTFNPEYSSEVYQKVMEQEIGFAASAGIDYWAFGYEAHPHAGVRSGLRDALDAYLASPQKDRIHFCVIVNCTAVAKTKYYEPESLQHSEDEIAQDWSSNYVADIVELTKEPSYQRVLGNRPLIYLYMPEFLGEGRRQTPAPMERLEQCIRELRERLQNEGCGNPYIAGMIRDTQPEEWEPLYDKGLLDCVTLYHKRYAGKDLPYGKLWGFIKSQTLYGAFKRPDMKVIPTTMSGANGMPRYTKGGPFPVWDWTEPAPGELTAQLHGAFDYVAAHPDKCEARTVIMYAWNEHSEGGFLCPTMGDPPDYQPVTRQIDELAEALKNWVPSTHCGPAGRME